MGGSVKKDFDPYKPRIMMNLEATKKLEWDKIQNLRLLLNVGYFISVN
jgi:hypothetical protein